MKILCTFPGKIGDALWSLPTVRAISRHFSQPVDFCMSKKYGQAGLMKLIQEQDYISKAFVLDSWEITDEQHHMIPREPEVQGYDKVFHLGYNGWPSCELAKYVYEATAESYQELSMLPTQLDMSPWITLESSANSMLFPYIFVGWNQEWIELKMGLTAMLTKAVPLPLYFVCHADGMRHAEFPEIKHAFIGGVDMYSAADVMARANFYLGDLSAQWVLACAMGKPCVVMEPSEARWNPIFWWDGDGRNTLVRGGDGKPTFDARHVADEVKKELKRCGF
jgi:hypothetical protein